MGLEIGLLFSTTGPYAALGRNALDGALMALAEIEAEGGPAIVAHVRDPGGQPEAYERMTDDLLRSGRTRHVVGAITSWSRKDMIPALERRGGLLWYPCPYEGFESSDHVVYLGACPNQHMLPLLGHLARARPARAFLVGSNYVWGWETLRLARERLGAMGVAVAGERYLPLGDEDAGRLAREVAASGAEVVINSLIGPSNRAFLTALRAAGAACTVASCNQTEADLADLGPAGDGLVSIGAWFERAHGAANRGFLRRIAARHGAGYRASCFFATTYAAVRLLAAGVVEAGDDAPRQVFAAVAARPRRTVLGDIAIDPVSRHASLTPHLARAAGGAFEIIAAAPAPVAPDPYLAAPPAHGPAAPAAGARPALRVVTDRALAQGGAT